MNKLKLPFLSSKNEAPLSEPEIPLSEPEIPVSEPEIPVSEPEVARSEPEVARSESEVARSESEVPVFESEVPIFESEVPVFESQPLFAEEPAPLMQPRRADELASLHENAKFLQDLATRIWRAQKQLDKALQKSDEPNLERFARRFEEIGETLSDYGIEIIDHTGQNYDVGLTLTVLQFEPTPGIARETICETIKPSLRVHGTLIPGQVVVAAPMAEEVEASEEL